MLIINMEPKISVLHKNCLKKIAFAGPNLCFLLLLAQVCLFIFFCCGFAEQQFSFAFAEHRKVFAFTLLGNTGPKIIKVEFIS